MGSIFGGGNDVQAPDYSAQIAALKEAGAQAARVGQFRPVTVTTSFGTPQYTYDEAGRLTGASYTPASWLQQLQQGSQNLATGYQAQQARALQDFQGLAAAERAFGAGGQLYGAAQQALPTSYDTTQATQDYYNRMQQLVAPERERQLATTRQSLFNKGRTGLATGATQAGGQLATNPEMAAYYNAIAQQDLNLANQAEQQALANLTQRTNLATNLFGVGGAQSTMGGQQQNQYYQNLAASQVPSTVNLANLGTMETMAQSPLALGLQFGTPATQGAQYGATMQYNAANAAANLGAAQERARVEAANANNAPGFWESLGGTLLTTGLTAGLGAFTGGLGTAAAGGLGGLFSGATAGGVTGLGAAGASQLLGGSGSSIPGIGGGSPWGNYGIRLGGY